MVTVFIIAILAVIALPQYAKSAEKSRSTEAVNILGKIFDAERGYYLEFDSYTSNLSRLGVNVPAACNQTYYYNYAVNLTSATTYLCKAKRCNSGGKQPNYSPYNITIDQVGNLIYDGF